MCGSLFFISDAVAGCSGHRLPATGVCLGQGLGDFGWELAWVEVQKHMKALQQHGGLKDMVSALLHLPCTHSSSPTAAQTPTRTHAHAPVGVTSSSADPGQHLTPPARTLPCSPLITILTIFSLLSLPVAPVPKLSPSFVTCPSASFSARWVSIARDAAGKNGLGYRGKWQNPHDGDILVCHRAKKRRI